MVEQRKYVCIPDEKVAYYKQHGMTDEDILSMDIFLQRMSMSIWDDFKEILVGIALLQYEVVRNILTNKKGKK